MSGGAGWSSPREPPASLQTLTYSVCRSVASIALQIEYGLLTDPQGRPAAVRVLPGNTGDPAAFTEIVQVVRDKFGLAKMVMIGDRGDDHQRPHQGAEQGRGLARPGRIPTGGSPHCAPRPSRS